MIAKLSQPDRPSDAAAASEDAMQLQMQALSAHQVLLITPLCTACHHKTQGCILLTLAIQFDGQHQGQGQVKSFSQLMHHV